ncbi:hypothetical protein JHK85_011863 [Glycine max]|nr:hypothetical protein JHK85_011863 [Glycine max]
MLSLWFPTAGSVVPRGDFFAILLLPLLLCTTFTSTEAHDALDPTGNITIKWDVISWTPDGYIAVVTTNNFQQYRHIQAPGWILGWTWAKKEKDPTVADLLPGTPYNQPIANFCSGEVLTSWAQDPQNAISSFQLSVGLAGTTNETVKLPKKFYPQSTRWLPKQNRTWQLCRHPNFDNVTQVFSVNFKPLTPYVGFK